MKSATFGFVAHRRGGFHSLRQSAIRAGQGGFISASVAESIQLGGHVCRLVCTMARAIFRRVLHGD